MSVINRQVIEKYYEDEWGAEVSARTLNLLIELTCKAYHLNQPQSLSFIKNTDSSLAQNLGQI